MSAQRSLGANFTERIMANIQRTAWWAAAFGVCFLSGQVAADAGHDTAGNELPQIRAMIKTLIDDNDYFVRSRDADYFGPLVKGQSPRATVVTCADSRVHANAFDRKPEGDMFLVRNIGNQIANSEGSIEYGVRHLHTPLLVIIGHSVCGAVKAAMTDYTRLEAPIKRELAGIEVAGRNADSLGDVKKSVETNVNSQVRYAMRKFAPEMEAGRLAVMGAVFDFRNDYGLGSGRLVVTNINGETHPDKIKASGLLPVNSVVPRRE